jgi:hypothetical protein
MVSKSEAPSQGGLRAPSITVAPVDVHATVNTMLSGMEQHPLQQRVEATGSLRLTQ